MVGATEFISNVNATSDSGLSTTLQITVSNSECVQKNETTIAHWANDPLFYIITVLMFYAFSIIILMIKYIRRERQEAEFDNYYYEFVTREKFQTPQFKNAQHLSSFLKNIQYKKLSSCERQEAIDNCPTLDTIVDNDRFDNNESSMSHGSEKQLMESESNLQSNPVFVGN